MFYNYTYTQLFSKEVSIWLKTFQVTLEPLKETHVLFGITNHKGAVTLRNFLQQLATFWVEVSWEPESRWRYQKMRKL